MDTTANVYTVSSRLKRLNELGIVVPYAMHGRNQLYRFDPYLNLLGEELLMVSP